jgi:hypothetical protein
MKLLILILITTTFIKANDTITLNPGSIVITKDTIKMIFVPPPVTNIKLKEKTNWSRVKDLFL